jgi:hypothetical protein
MGDNLCPNKIYNMITSGSSGEGLDMKGSDLDFMLVFKDVNVYEDINSARLNSDETCVVMEMDDTKLGFSRLRLIHCNKIFTAAVPVNNVFDKYFHQSVAE